MKAIKTMKFRRGQTWRSSMPYLFIARDSTRCLAWRRWRSSNNSNERAANRARKPALFVSRGEQMNTTEKSSVFRKKWIAAAIGVPLLIGAWWAFRPEKLFINQKVSESAPVAVGSEPEPIYTGKLEGKVHA